MLCLAVGGTAAHAGPSQVIDRKTLTLDGARIILSACEAEAARLGASGVIAVVDDGGHLIALHRIDGTFAAGANISIGKARTAALFRKPTRVFEETINGGRTAMVALAEFTPLQGGVPIEVDGQVVGAVGVSGAASAQQDEQVALVGVAALVASLNAPAKCDPSASAAYFDRDTVAAAYERGATLFSDDAATGCTVNASRRDGPGQVEVHLDDTDIMYIQEGAATLVTGGDLVDPHRSAVDEIRAADVTRGESRTVGPGDVVVVPHGVPHWFKDVQGTLHYLVVKVQSGPANMRASGAPNGVEAKEQS
jgi:glc operon protein GlcG